MVIDLEELKSYLYDQYNLIVDLNISVANLQRLSIQEFDFEDQIKRHGFFQHHKYQLRFISIIQLSKLFKKGEKRSFHKLCNKLETSSYGANLNKLLENNKIKSTGEVKSKTDILNLIKTVRSLLIDNDLLIEKVINLRVVA